MKVNNDRYWRELTAVASLRGGNLIAGLGSLHPQTLFFCVGYHRLFNLVPRLLEIRGRKRLFSVEF